MTLYEILAEIDEKYPNALANDSKVRKINNLQNKLFRTAVNETEAIYMNIIGDISEYEIDFPPSRIRKVLVNGFQYPYKQIESAGDAAFCYVVGNILGVYPVPTEDSTNGLLIYKYRDATQLSSSNLTVVPDFDPDYHNILVYGVCKELAENDARYDVANAFMTQYMYELEQYEIANQDLEPAQIQEVW